MQSLITEDSKYQELVQTNGLIPERKARVVIIGAGLAGLATAQRLHESGVREVIVLDAQSRVGGRVHTINHSDFLLELGAQWLHGADENPLHKWLIEKNMLNDFEDASSGFQGLFCTNRGYQVDPQLVEKVLKIVVDSKLALSSKTGYTDMINTDGTAQTAAEVFKRQLEAELESDDALKSNKRLVYALFDWFLRYENVENGCDSMDQVSIASYTDWTDWGNGTLLNFRHGYRSLLHWFCQQIPTKRWIHLNKRVINVEMLESNGPLSSEYNDDEGRHYSSPVLVRYTETSPNSPKSKDSDTGRIGLIECDHVIVTVSLGFLKKNHETFFKPQLPEVKTKLIKSMGFGTVNKIILQFETPFWDTDLGVKLVWEERDRGKFPEWAYDITAFDVVRRQPNLLIGWIGGYGAKLMEQESDSSIAETCLQILNQFLPTNYNKPSRLVSCICSRWNSNPYTCGSYSFQSIESLHQQVDKLHEPLYNSPGSATHKLGSSSSSRMPRVLFAGEATAGKLYATTIGAVISGWREADRLTDHLVRGKKANIQPTLGTNSQQYLISQQ